MTTAEATAMTLSRLSEPNLLKASRYIERLFERQKRQVKKPGLKVYTKEEFIELINQSVEDSKAGRVYTMEEDREYVRQKYGF